MRWRGGVTAMVVGAVAVLAGCQGVPGEPAPARSDFPSIEVTSGATAIDWVVGMNRLGDSITDRQDTLVHLMDAHAAADLPHLADGARITIAFASDPPSGTRLTEHVIRPDGRPKYTTETEGRDIDVVFKRGTGSFVLAPNWATALSSNSADYAPGAILKGFRLVANWGTDECEYAFVIRGDAAILMSPG